MSFTEVVVAGTLNPDGTLKLDQKPSLSPGRVTVVLRQESQPTTHTQPGWWQAMQDARKRMEDAGCHFMDDKEMQDHLNWLREEDGFDVMLRELNQQGKALEQS
jgi:hypothetical protein